MIVIVTIGARGAPRGTGPSVTLDAAKGIAIGTARACTIRLIDPEIDPVHCAVAADPQGELYVVDRSKLGAWIGEEKIDRHARWSDDAPLRIGGHALWFEPFTPKSDTSAYSSPFMSSRDRLARLGLAHLANDPAALKAALEAQSAEYDAKLETWRARQTALSEALRIAKRR